MRQVQQNNKRMRGRNRKGPNPLTRSYESNGPDVKIRGTAMHIAEKYTQLARDASSSGDRVMAENYLQHAEHYYRIIATAQAALQPSFGRDDVEEGDDDLDPVYDRFDRPTFPQQNGNGFYGDRPERDGPEQRFDRGQNDRQGGGDRQDRQDRGGDRQGGGERYERQDRRDQPHANRGEQRFDRDRPDRGDRPERQDRQDRQRHGGDRYERRDAPPPAAEGERPQAAAEGGEPRQERGDRRERRQRFERNGFERRDRGERGGYENRERPAPAGAAPMPLDAPQPDVSFPVEVPRAQPEPAPAPAPAPVMPAVATAPVAPEAVVDAAAPDAEGERPRRRRATRPRTRKGDPDGGGTPQDSPADAPAGE